MLFNQDFWFFGHSDMYVCVCVVFGGALNTEPGVVQDYRIRVNRVFCALPLFAACSCMQLHAACSWLTHREVYTANK